MERQVRCSCDDPWCDVGSRLRRLTRARIRLSLPRSVAVKTWCRVCGQPVLVNVVCDYDYAERHFSALDDAPMVHRNTHAEVGGWGVHWRLDDVLRIVFPSLHNYEIWPKPAWYEHSRAEGMPVELLGNEYAEQFREGALIQLERELDETPQTREELENYGEVWDENVFSAQFENLGYRPPFVLVRNHRTGEQGTVLFQNYPRLYFGYDRDRVI